jgi:hypothetical protein
MLLVISLMASGLTRRSRPLNSVHALRIICWQLHLYRCGSGLLSVSRNIMMIQKEIRRLLQMQVNISHPSWSKLAESFEVKSKVQQATTSLS